MARENAVDDGSARSVKGAQGGLQQASVGTTAHAFDVTAWKGRYIKFGAVGDDWYYVFSTSSSTTIDATTNATAETATVPDRAADGTTESEVVPGDALNPNENMYLLIRAVSDTLSRVWVRRS